VVLGAVALAIPVGMAVGGGWLIVFGQGEIR
jgi:hypothetical protein